MTCVHMGTGRTCGLGVWPGSVSPGVCARCDRYDGPARGVGDLVASATKAVGIRPCGRCQKRREALNAAVPFSSSVADQDAP